MKANARSVPDDYVQWKRFAGVYPVASRFVRAGIERLHVDQQPILRTHAVAAPNNGTVRYRLEPLAAPVDEDESWRMEMDALSIPRLSFREATRLIHRHAPQFVIETNDDNDRIGAVELRAGDGVAVDTSIPILCVDTARTRFEGQTYLQLVYTVWFPSRLKTGPLDTLGGHLDGITWRVTLDADGTPLLYDVMHNCGYYHIFFPTPKLRRKTFDDWNEESLWSPFTVPADWHDPPSIHLASRSHYVEALSPGSTEHGIRLMGVRDYDSLRSLPAGDGRWASLFDANGLIPSTARLERWLLWPTGVRSPGAMRQWGHHATAFIGRRHFDDADLIERYF